MRSRRTRKQFIVSQGATCPNWAWSWLFVNHRKREVIFGAWKNKQQEMRTIILSTDWQFLKGPTGKPHKQAGYGQALTEIRLARWASQSFVVA